MKKIKFSFIALATITPIIGCASPNATVTVRVVDDERTPISGVRTELINIYDYGVITEEIKYDKINLTHHNIFLSIGIFVSF